MLFEAFHQNHSKVVSSCFLSSRLHVGVEDGQSETYILVTLVVSPHMTIAQLKDKVPAFQPTKQVTPVLSFDHT